MYEDEEKSEARKQKFYKNTRLFIFIALAVASGNLLSSSIENYIAERELKGNMVKAEALIKSEVQKMDEEFNKLINSQKTSFADQERNKQQRQMKLIKQQVKDADCDFWIAQSRVEKTSEAMTERIEACKAAGRQGY